MTVGSQVKQCYATIKHIEATLQELSLKTTDNEAKRAYEEAYDIVTETKQSLQEQLTFIQTEEPKYK